jgi:diguanylate cyclase
MMAAFYSGICPGGDLKKLPMHPAPIKGLFTIIRYGEMMPSDAPSKLQRLVQHFWPPVPPMIADDMAQLRYASMQAQMPLLFLTIIAVVLITMSSAHPDASFWIRLGLPTAIIGILLFRLGWWLTHGRQPQAPEVARQRLLQTTVIACLIAFGCAVWTSGGWVASIQGTRSYYPMFMALGTLSAAFCLSTIRFTAIALLAAALSPVIMVLTTMGDTIDRIAALIVAIAAIFLARLIIQRHQQLVQLLTLQHQMRVLADTDPLTGLANRRRLLQHLESALTAGEQPALLLIDLDGFKPVNDRHGHAMGDRLLCAVAERMRSAVNDDALLCRLGGDEFALVCLKSDASGARHLADRVLAALVAPFSIDDAQLRIGASIGIAMANAGSPDAMQLIHQADQQLYAAKAERRRAPKVAQIATKAG